MLNFTVIQRAPYDKQWGSLAKDGKTWNGMILELINDKLDIATSGLSITYDRALAVDYRLEVMLSWDVKLPAFTFIIPTVLEYLMVQRLCWGRAIREWSSIGSYTWKS